MAIVKSEFALALNQVATERGISVDDVMSSMEAAILAAYKKEYPEHEEDEDIAIKVSKTTGETKIMKGEDDITPPGFGRIAAQTARQVIIQKIREAEKKTVISHYKDQMGTIVRGRVIRYDGYNAHIDLGKAEGFLPKEEQMRNENYAVNTSLIFYLKAIADDKMGHSRIVVSRSDPALIVELFKREVPEISSGTVEIKKVVREPGERSKIAVHSSQGGVDPVGACVGQKGVRVQTVTDELGGMEKIDIIQWNADNKTFLMSALSPAKIVDVVIDEAKKHARVRVEESQAPLAIGKSGINVNLASRLAGYEIDIEQIASEKPETPEVKEEIPPEEAPSAVEEAPAETPETETVEETPVSEVTEEKE